MLFGKDAACRKGVLTAHGPLALQAGHSATGRVEEALLARGLGVGPEGGRGRALLLGQAHGCRASPFHS